MFSWLMCLLQKAELSRKLSPVGSPGAPSLLLFAIAAMHQPPMASEVRIQTSGLECSIIYRYGEKWASATRKYPMEACMAMYSLWMIVVGTPELEAWTRPILTKFEWASEPTFWFNFRVAETLCSKPMTLRRGSFNLSFITTLECITLLKSPMKRPAYGSAALSGLSFGASVMIQWFK